MADTAKLFSCFNVRIVRKGERYGLADCLLHEGEKPLVEFYDFRHRDNQEWKRGQFVSRYYAETLLGDATFGARGLALCGDIPEWDVAPEVMAEIIHWLREELPEVKLTAKQLSRMNFERKKTAPEADRILNGLARAVIRAVRRENGEKCYLGKFNPSQSVKTPGLRLYTHGKIYNFDCDFVLPQYDEEIHNKMLEYHAHRERGHLLEEIFNRIFFLNGHSIFWS